MAKQTFTTGQVLTAAQMTSLQQTAMLGGAASAKTASYTLVAADAGTSISMSNASATTITVNTALFAAGDTVQITNLGAGVCTITAGTATVNSSASLALAQYESGTLDFTSASAAIFIKGAGAAAASGGMTLISETVASALSSLSFSSLGSYKQLLLVWHGIQHNAASNIFNIRFNSDSGNNYIWFNNYWGGGHGHEVSTQSYACQQGIAPFGYQTSGAGASEVANGFLLLDNYTSTTKTKAYQIQNFMRTPGDSAGDSRGGNTTGYYNSTSAITSIDVFRQSGASTFSNYSNTTIRLYGLS